MAQFNDTTNQNGVIQKIEFITGLGSAGISGNSTLLKQMTGLVNDWLGIMVGDILQCDGRYEWDDTNYGDQPIATFNLVADQTQYSVTTDDNSAEILDITRVEVKNSATGDWIKLRPIDQRDIQQGFTEWREASSIPQYFDWNGSVMTLFPASSYNSTNGAKIFFKREPSYFASTDTTKEASIGSPFQKILWLGPSYDYALQSGRGNLNALRQEIELERERLREFYSRRNKYEQPRITGRVRSSR